MSNLPATSRHAIALGATVAALALATVSCGHSHRAQPVLAPTAAKACRSLRSANLRSVAPKSDPRSSADSWYSGRYHEAEASTAVEAAGPTARRPNHQV
jgi:hypothetical protein